MSTKIYSNARFGFRSDTLINWQTENPILEKGEPSVVSNASDEKWLKIGDGARHWNDLPWYIGPKGDKGDKGDKGEDAVTDLSYNPTSGNAQSGTAVSEAVATHNESTEAHADIRESIDANTSQITYMNSELTSLQRAISSNYNAIDRLEQNTLPKEAATWYDNLNLAVNGVFEFKPNSLIFCSGNGKNLTLRKWNGTAYETLVENSPTIICICSNMQYNNDAGTSKWEALFVYQTEKSYGLVTLPTMVVDATTISPTYDNTLTVTNTGNENTNSAYIFYQHTGE